MTIGPVIENGFYYDFFRNQPFTLEDVAAIEKKMNEIIARDALHQGGLDREQTKQVFRDKGEMFKVELVDAIPADQIDQDLPAGRLVRSLPRPAYASTGKIGKAFKLMKVAGAFRRGDTNNPMLTRIYGTAFANQAELDAYLSRWKRRRSATIASLAANSICSISRKKVPAWCSGTPRAGPSSRS